MGTQPRPPKGAEPLPILRVVVENFEIGPEVPPSEVGGALPVIANFVALEQQRILVKTRSESV